MGKLSLRAAPDAKHGHCKCLNRPAEPVAPVRAVVIAFATAGRLHRRAAQVRTAPPAKSPKARRHRRWRAAARPARSEEHTSELQSLMRISYAVFCLKKKKKDIR